MTIFMIYKINYKQLYFKLITELPHTQGNQENSGSFKTIENIRKIPRRLKEIQGI